MPESKCPKCSNQSFEIQKHKPDGSSFDISFVQCSNCGSIVGTIDYVTQYYAQKDHDKRLNDIKKQLSQIIEAINKIDIKLRK